MTWPILAVLAIGLFLTYVIWQETRSHLHWRALVAQGNVWAIRELLTAEIDRWHEIRPPRGVPVAVWAGVQSAELVAVGRDHVQVACSTEGEYRMAGGRREQVISSLDAGMRLASKLIDMLLYDIPEVKVKTVRIDVFSTFHTSEGAPEQRCILSTCAQRSVANALSWEELSPREILDCFEIHYHTDEHGMVQAIDPGPPLPDEPAEETMPDEVKRAQLQESLRKRRSSRSPEVEQTDD